MKISFLIIPVFLICVFPLLLPAGGDYTVQRVDFLARHNIDVNGAGPLLVRVDAARNRVILVNTNTSSISIIDGKTHAVTNIPVKSRVPQYLKSAALTIDKKTGNIYVIGNKSLHVVFPAKKSSVTIPTTYQYEMAAVYEKNGNAFLVGRQSPYLAIVQLKSKTIKTIKWVEHTEAMINLNQTPPPPIRKVVCDNTLDRVAALDGFTSTLYLFSAKTGKLVKKRKLAVKGGTRWHTAGYNETTHHLYTVIETAAREVIEAIKIDIDGNKDTIIPLPSLHEAVGMAYHPGRDEVYIGYDNDPTVHILDFNAPAPSFSLVSVPTYGNDAAAVDSKNDILYMSDWGYGNISAIDLKTRRFIKRIRHVGVIPHMFNMDFNPLDGHLFVPIGASAVNGSFGASLNRVDPAAEKIDTIYTGWAPVALAPIKDSGDFLVFNSENQAARVTPGGSVTYHTLPCRFINNAMTLPSGAVYVTYGPHQSYWPTVYIWAAKNGILSFDGAKIAAGTFYDRRIPRMIQRMTLDKNNVFYALQNNWGGEEQFMLTLPDEVRDPNLGRGHIKLVDTVTTETTQRILEYDGDRHWLYIVRVGEANDKPGILQVYDIETGQILLKYPTGLTPTHLVFDKKTVYITNFDENTIAVIDKEHFSFKKIKTGEKPFKLALLDNTLYCINHNANTLQSFRDGKPTAAYPLPFKGKPSNLFSTGDTLIITGHHKDALHIVSFDTGKKTFNVIHKEVYPFGETTVDTDNTAFYMRGQFADGIFELNQIKQDKKGRIWITDYLSGKLFILK
jgi:DNA-binding beta-propeller fold protein YncE